MIATITLRIIFMVKFIHKIHHTNSKHSNHSLSSGLDFIWEWNKFEKYEIQSVNDRHHEPINIYNVSRMWKIRLKNPVDWCDVSRSIQQIKIIFFHVITNLYEPIWLQWHHKCLPKKPLNYTQRQMSYTMCLWRINKKPEIFRMLYESSLLFFKNEKKKMKIETNQQQMHFNYKIANKKKLSIL